MSECKPITPGHAFVTRYCDDPHDYVQTRSQPSAHVVRCAECSANTSKFLRADVWAHDKHRASGVATVIRVDLDEGWSLLPYVYNTTRGMELHFVGQSERFA